MKHRRVPYNSRLAHGTFWHKSSLTLLYTTYDTQNVHYTATMNTWWLPSVACTGFSQKVRKQQFTVRKIWKKRTALHFVCNAVLIWC